MSINMLTFVVFTALPVLALGQNKCDKPLGLSGSTEYACTATVADTFTDLSGQGLWNKDYGSWKGT